MTTSIEKIAKAANDAEQRVLAFLTGNPPALWKDLTSDQRSGLISTAQSEVDSGADLDVFLANKRAEVGAGDSVAVAHAAFQSVCFSA